MGGFYWRLVFNGVARILCTRMAEVIDDHISALLGSTTDLLVWEFSCFVIISFF